MTDTPRERALGRLRELLTDEWILRVALLACADHLAAHQLDQVVQRVLETREALEDRSAAVVRIYSAPDVHDPRD